MKKIEKLGELEICYPQILTKQRDCKNGQALHIFEVINKMLCKIDELVEEVNKLKREQGLF